MQNNDLNKDIQKSLKQIERKIQKAEDKWMDLKKDRDIILSHSKVECQSSVHGYGCGAIHQIKDLTYIQIMYYDNEAYNEHWAESDGEFDCPSCGCRNRLYTRPEIQKLKKLFCNGIKQEKRI